MQTALLFDFDGVLCDSVLECFITAYNAYGLTFARGHHVVYSADAIDDEWQGAFLRYRPMVRTAGEYGLLWKAIVEQRHLDESVPLREQVDTLSDEDLGRFMSAFFSFRNDWRVRERGSWLRCHTVYPGIPELLQAAKGTTPMFILSAKDRKSLCDLVESYRWPIPATHIYGLGDDKDKDTDKDDHWALLVRDHGLTPERCYYVDDNVRNLRLLESHGVRPLWAKWGYLTLQELALESLDGIKVLEQVSQLHSWMSHRGLIGAIP